MDAHNTLWGEQGECMIENGKEMDWRGHHLVFESEPSNCRGCFFENRDSCPDCDKGIWVEDKAGDDDTWHTGTPTEDGWYWIEYHPFGDKDREPRYMVMEFKDGSFFDEVTSEAMTPYCDFWKRITPNKEANT